MASIPETSGTTNNTQGGTQQQVQTEAGRQQTAQTEPVVAHNRLRALQPPPLTIRKVVIQIEEQVETL